MNKYITAAIVAFVFGILATELLGTWGFFITVIIVTLYLIYEELREIKNNSKGLASFNEYIPCSVISERILNNGWFPLQNL
ncbi:hypothetical protein IQ283_18715 [Alkalihalobacillus hwajinpoensis]|uniref:hypothetical protein n=1 Tax=Guptibacillus hwajinpoensis TaxID=208199 RepID=UPI001883B487|nr:hypothetical protein [Pseudalkalibacillus hwajinpoensis]MBF0708634.1 hypothetical protein [Pseudalkalibacillus hwajinpoensis]